jgi:lactoylglutathione lyase
MNQDNLKHSTYDSHFGYAHISISVGSKEMVDNITSQMKADGIFVKSGPRTTGDGYYEPSKQSKTNIFFQCFT